MLQQLWSNLPAALENCLALRTDRYVEHCMHLAHNATLEKIIIVIWLFLVHHYRLPHVAAVLVCLLFQRFPAHHL